MRSIHHQSLLSVLARIQNTFCKKVYGYILCCFGIPFCAFCVCYYDGDHHDHQCATVTLTILLCMGLLRLGSQSGICECSILVLFHASFSGSARQIGRRKLCQSGLTSSHFHIKVLFDLCESHVWKTQDQDLLISVPCLIQC